MSYQFTAYFNDAGIATTEIYNPQYGMNYRRSYGASNLVQSGFDGSMRFTATPADGYEFSRWVYHVGSISAAVQYSYSNPFTYTEEEDIWIRAESTGGGGGGGSEGSWSVTSKDAGTVTAEKYVYFTIDPYKISRASVKFSKSGTAIFSSSGDVDVVGYLTTGTSFDAQKGRPTSYIARDDDGGEGSNFSIEYDVEANKTYYIWVRAYEPDTDSQVTINIIPPGGGGSITGKGVYIYSGGKWVKATPYIYNNGWKKMKPCLYSGGWITGT